MLRKTIADIEDTVKGEKEELKKLTEIKKEKEKDTLKTAKVDSLLVKEKSIWVDSVQVALADMKQEYDQLKTVFLESGSEAERYGREMQAKYVDWAFMRYQEKKAELEKMREDIVERSKKEPEAEAPDTSRKDTLGREVAAADTTPAEKKPPEKEKERDIVSLFTSIDIDNMIKSISDDRVRLVEHIEMLLDASPGSSYNPQVLFRLAELYYDEASEVFRKPGISRGVVCVPDCGDVRELNIPRGDTGQGEQGELPLDIYNPRTYDQSDPCRPGAASSAAAESEASETPDPFEGCTEIIKVDILDPKADDKEIGTLYTVDRS